MSKGNRSKAYDCKVETIGKVAVIAHLAALETVLYPDCAVIAYKPSRETCCDEIVRAKQDAASATVIFFT